jgi:carbonic anhydrase/acetyltransferase-like protein (isoleucine patch superfamily)
VGAGAVVSGGTEVPSRAMALGVPAKIRPDAAPAEGFANNVALYVANGHRYRAELRRLD